MYKFGFKPDRQRERCLCETKEAKAEFIEYQVYSRKARNRNAFSGFGIDATGLLVRRKISNYTWPVIVERIVRHIQSRVRPIAGAWIG